MAASDLTCSALLFARMALCPSSVNPTEVVLLVFGATGMARLAFVIASSVFVAIDAIGLLVGALGIEAGEATGVVFTVGVVMTGAVVTTGLVSNFGVSFG